MLERIEKTTQKLLTNSWSGGHTDMAVMSIPETVSGLSGVDPNCTLKDFEVEGKKSGCCFCSITQIHSPFSYYTHSEPLPLTPTRLSLRGATC